MVSLTYILRRSKRYTNLKKWFTYHYPNPGLIDSYEIKVGPKLDNTSYSGEIGTAFDYLFRFKLEHLNKRTFSKTKDWVAQSGLKGIIAFIDSDKSQTITLGYSVIKKKDRQQFKHSLLSEFEKAKVSHRRFVKNGKLTRDFVKSCVFLAKLDVYRRTFFIDNSFDEIKEETINEVEELFNIVPWKEFKTKKCCILNPTFSSRAAGIKGDGDLILDDILIDIKSSKELKLRREDLNQVIGYFLMSKLGKQDFNILRIGIYFARYGVLWQLKLSDYYNIEDHIKRAKEFQRLIANPNLQLVNVKSKRPQKLFQQAIKDFNDFDSLKCPNCDSVMFIKNGKSGSKFRYKCKDCNKSFTSEQDEISLFRFKNMTF